ALVEDTIGSGPLGGPPRHQRRRADQQRRRLRAPTRTGHRPGDTIRTPSGGRTGTAPRARPRARSGSTASASSPGGVGMGVLDRFEKSVERVVNTAFAKAFRSELKPVELASALRREVDDRAAVVGRDRTVVPNEFTIELSPAD